MCNLYLITGPAGVGKSTISMGLAKLFRKSVLIEGDDIYHQVVGGYVQAWKDGNHLQTFWKVCINIIETYLQDEYDVLFNYIITPENLKLLKESFKNYNIKFTVLLADEEVLLSRDKKRAENCQMKERCIVLLNDFKSKNYNKQNILDTTHISIEKIVKIIQNSQRFII